MSGRLQAYWENWVPSDASKEEEDYISGLKDQIFALYKKKDFAQVLGEPLPTISPDS